MMMAVMMKNKMIIVILMMTMNCFVVWLTNERYLALFPVKTIIRDPHHRESLTCREHSLNMCRTRVQV